MSVSFNIDEGVLHFEFQGVTRSHEVFGTFHKAYEDPRCPEAADMLVDLRGSSSLKSRSMESVRLISEFVVKHPHRPGQSIAILVEDEERKKFEPVAAEFTEQTGVAIRIFDDQVEAQTWLHAGR